MAITYLLAQPVSSTYSQKARRSICRASDGRIYVSYRVGAGLGPYVAWIGYSDDNGLTWTFELIPDQIPGDTNEVICLATDSNDNLIAVWVYAPGAGTPTQILYRKRSPAGVWGATVVVANQPLRQLMTPSVAIDSVDTAHIVWSEWNPPVPAAHTEEIYYNTVDAAGVLGAQLNISQQFFAFKNLNPKIAICKNDIAHIVWQGWGMGVWPGTSNIKYNTVVAGVPGVPALLSDTNALHSTGTLATDSGGNVHVVWLEWAGLPTVGFTYRNNIGGWNPPIILNNYNQEGGMSITLDAEDNVYAFHSQRQFPNAHLIIYKNGIQEYDELMQGGGSNDIYTMHSWYPRSGGSSPNILSNNWLAYSFWPITPPPDAYLMFPAPLPPPSPPAPPPPTPVLNVLTLPATEIR